METYLLKRLCFVSLLVFSLSSTASDSYEFDDIKVYYDMYHATARGDVEKVRLALEQGLDPNWRDSPFDIIPMLHRAINCGHLSVLKDEHIDVVKLLLEAGANPNVQSKNRNDTALILAASCSQKDNKSVELVQLLLDFGADMQLKNRDGWGPLTQATYSRNDPVATLLYKRDPKQKIKISTAISSNMPLLLEAAINMGYPYSGEALLFWSIDNNHPNALKALLDAGENPNSFMDLNLQNTAPILVAVAENKIELVKILIEYGADVTVKDSLGRDIRNIASQKGYTELTKYLNSIN